MMKNQYVGKWLGFMSLLLWLPSFILAAPTLEQRTAFLEVEKIVSQTKTDEFLAQIQELKDYPLYPYLYSVWLRKHLDKTDEITLFLARYKNTRYANLVRTDWLDYLAKHQQWEMLLNYYAAALDSEKPNLQCAYGWGLYNTDKQNEALIFAKNLWLNLKTFPASCNELLNSLRQSDLMKADMLWQRFITTLQAKKVDVALAVSLKKQMPVAMQAKADLWLQVQHNPLAINKLELDKTNPEMGEIFAYSVDKLIAKNLALAVDLWSAQQADFKIETATRDLLEQHLGMALMRAKDFSTASAHLMKATTLDAEARQTLVRMALREQNWAQVAQALNKLNVEEKAEDKWKYWQARTFAEMGKTNEATQLFTEIAKSSGFYAFLAADKIKQAYQIVDKPVPVTNDEIENLKQTEDFQVIAELFALDRETEALAQWWFLIKKFDKPHIMLAAKIAQQWQMPKLAAFTLAKADYWTDLEIRFPIAYTEFINENAVQANLDPALIFGLIRQESVFDEYALSPVGACGLMQIMPATGKQIAKRLQEKWQSSSLLFQPETNIRYGVNYYKNMLNRFHGQVAFATAAYNAGPNRIPQWLPDKPMAMDIWIETIPFTETRRYVGMVLGNALFYQARLKGNTLKISDFMSEVQPLVPENSAPNQTEPQALPTEATQ